MAHTLLMFRTVLLLVSGGPDQISKEGDESEQESEAEPTCDIQQFHSRS
jgi:hypothetical protein